MIDYDPFCGTATRSCGVNSEVSVLRGYPGDQVSPRKVGTHLASPPAALVGDHYMLLSLQIKALGCTVRLRGMGTGTSEASKRVPISSFATQGGKQVSSHFRQGNWVQVHEHERRTLFPIRTRPCDAVRHVRGKLHHCTKSRARFWLVGTYGRGGDIINGSV